MYGTDISIFFRLDWKLITSVIALIIAILFLTVKFTAFLFRWGRSELHDMTVTVNYFKYTVGKGTRKTYRMKYFIFGRKIFNKFSEKRILLIPPLGTSVRRFMSFITAFLPADYRVYVIPPSDFLKFANRTVLSEKFRRNIHKLKPIAEEKSFTAIIAFDLCTLPVLILSSLYGKKIRPIIIRPVFSDSLRYYTRSFFFYIFVYIIGLIFTGKFFLLIRVLRRIVGLNDLEEDFPFADYIIPVNSKYYNATDMFSVHGRFYFVKTPNPSFIRSEMLPLVVTLISVGP